MVNLKERTGEILNEQKVAVGSSGIRAAIASSSLVDKANLRAIQGHLRNCGKIMSLMVEIKNKYESGQDSDNEYTLQNEELDSMTTPYPENTIKMLSTSHFLTHHYKAEEARHSTNDQKL